jgi:hypothetical protein
MWRVQRLDQINAFNPANLFDFKSLALKFRKKQIGRFKTVIRPGPVNFPQRDSWWTLGEKKDASTHQWLFPRSIFRSGGHNRGS